MEIIIITLSSKDASILDVSLSRTLTLFPNSTVKLLPVIKGVDGTLYRRSITVTSISDKQREAVQKLDLPDNVYAEIRVEA